MNPAFLMEFPNAPPGAAQPLHALLDDAHAEARRAPTGVLAAQRYTAIEGDRRYFNFLSLTEASAARSIVAMEPATPETLWGLYTHFYPPDVVYREPGAATLLVIGHDISREHEEEYHAWYATEHIPIHLQLPGFLHAHRFVAVDVGLPAANAANGPRYITMYEVENDAAFRTPEYEKSRHSPWTHRMRRFYTQRFRSIFQRT